MQGFSINNSPIHIPVLKNEVVSFLDIRQDGIYVDGTCGPGGHSKIILEKLSSKGILISIDIDQEAINICRNELSNSFKNLHIKKNSYSNLPTILNEMGISKVSGIILDLGLSSLQLDSNHRGFSYKNNCHLDMRFDQSSEFSNYNYEFNNDDQPEDVNYDYSYMSCVCYSFLFIVIIFFRNILWYDFVVDIFIRSIIVNNLI